MGKKKKKLFPAYFFRTQPFASSRTQLPPFQTRITSTSSFEGDSIWNPSPRYSSLTWSEKIAFKEQARRGKAEEFGDAWGYYTMAGALDPKNPLLDARLMASAFGVGWWAGLGLSILYGAPIMGLALTVVDPKHKWEGGLDETRIYQAGEGGIAGAHPNLNKSIVMGQGSWGTVV